jgi:hypothetical protein
VLLLLWCWRLFQLLACRTAGSLAQNSLGVLKLLLLRMIADANP